MACRIDNKFVSREKYDAHHAQKKEATNMTEAEKTRKPRTTSPLTAATIRVRKAQKALAVAEKAHAKQTALPSLADAHAEVAAAVAELNAALGV